VSETANETEKLSNSPSRSPIPARQLVAEIELRPGEQLNISLGIFTEDNVPKGFSLHVEPDPDEDAIVAQITQLERDESTTEWMMLLANYGPTTVSAGVWRLT